MINHDLDRGQSLTIFETHTVLSLPEVKAGDSGNFTCAPANLRPASVLVHILDENGAKEAAAIHTDDGAVTSDAAARACANLLAFVLVFAAVASTN